MQAVRVRIREVVAHPSSFEKGSQIAEFTAPRFDLGGLVEISPSPTLRLQAPLKGLFEAKQTPCFKSVPALEPVRADRDADCSGPSFMDPGVIPLCLLRIRLFLGA